MTKIRKKFARIIVNKIEKMKNWKIFTIFIPATMLGVSSLLMTFTFTFELFIKIPLSIIRNQDLVQVLTMSNDELIAGYLLNSGFSLIQIIIIYILSLLCSLLTLHCMFRVDDDIDKLQEVVIPKAKKLINEYPKSKSILIPLIQEAENKDDGKNLLKILYEFYELRNLENKPKYLMKETNDKIKKIKEEEDLLKKKLGLS